MWIPILFFYFRWLRDTYNVPRCSLGSGQPALESPFSPLTTPLLLRLLTHDHWRKCWRSTAGCWIIWRSWAAQGRRLCSQVSLSKDYRNVLNKFLFQIFLRPSCSFSSLTPWMCIVILTHLHSLHIFSPAVITFVWTNSFLCPIMFYHVLY